MTARRSAGRPAARPWARGATTLSCVARPRPPRAGRGGRTAAEDRPVDHARGRACRGVSSTRCPHPPGAIRFVPPCIREPVRAQATSGRCRLRPRPRRCADADRSRAISARFGSLQRLWTVVFASIFIRPSDSVWTDDALGFSARGKGARPLLSRALLPGPMSPSDRDQVYRAAARAPVPRAASQASMRASAASSSASPLQKAKRA